MPKNPSPQRVKRHQIYTVWEAADAVGVHRQTVIRWIKDNRVRDLHEWIDANRVTSTSDRG